MKKILIVGGRSNLAKHFQSMYPKQSISLGRAKCDITSEKSLRKAISKFDGNYVLNCAALTNIDDCEQKLLKCFNINTFGAYLLNKVCLEKGKKLIHISSNYALDPVNNYGWSKYLSEKVISRNFLIIRTSFYSKDLFIIKNILKGKKIKVYKNLYFNPISINRLAEEIQVNLGKKGVINLFSSRKISYLKFARLICETFGINKNLIHPVSYGNENKTQRPINSFVEPDVNIDIKKDLLGFKKFCQDN